MDFIDSLYLVGTMSGGFTSEVEAFSPTVGGKPSVIYCYPSASSLQVQLAIKHGKETNLPVIVDSE